MTSAAAPILPSFHDELDLPAPSERRGSQTLLDARPPQPNYPARLGAAAVYALLLGATVTLSFKTNEMAVDEITAVQLAPLSVEEQNTPEPEPEIAQPEVPDMPLPLAMDPIAPVEKQEIKPPPKPQVKKVEKKIAPARNTQNAAGPARAATAVAPAARAPAAPPGATASVIANHFHACMQRAASNAYPEAMAPRTARISYHATFSASGSLTSYSISPSGIAAFDAIANRLGGRCGSVPAPGKPVSLSGSLTFSP